MLGVRKQGEKERNSPMFYNVKMRGNISKLQGNVLGENQDKWEKCEWAINTALLLVLKRKRQGNAILRGGWMKRIHGKKEGLLKVDQQRYKPFEKTTIW